MISPTQAKHDIHIAPEIGVPFTPEAAAWAASVGMAAEDATDAQRMNLNHRATFALPLRAFIAQPVSGAAPLIGTEDDLLAPRGGLIVTGGLAGTGKTTFAIDAAFHLASQVEWLGWPVPEALRVLVIENEGPREPFRRKLERKREAWPHAILGEIYVCTYRWASLTLADGETRTRLASFIDALHVDLVIADPLGGLGMEGVGSPADVRHFVDLMKEVGLAGDVAWWLLHHFRKESTVDEIDQFRGAWGDQGDAILALKNLEGDRVRLSYPKLRWAETREPQILGRDRATAGFTVLAEGIGERDYAAEILELLADGNWRTAAQINKPAGKGGIGASRETVLETLQTLAAQGHVDYAEGPPGHAQNAKCWRLHDPSCNLVQAAFPGEGLAACTTPYPLRSNGGSGASKHPRLHNDGASDVRSPE